MQIVPIIKTVGVACNLKCRYCWFNPLDQSKVHLMPNALLERLVRGYREADRGGSYQFIWHGGEPLMAGRGFYEEALALQGFYMKDVQIKNVLQTNATMLDERWVEFLMGHGFKVGVSLDGPKELHDYYRVTAAGNGSHDWIMRNLKRARELGLKFSVIATINHRNVIYPEEIFEFFVANDITSFGFNMVLERGPDGIPYEFSVSNDEYARFQTRIFDLWLERNDPRIRIRHVDAILTGMVGHHSKSCIYGGTCQRFINVNSNGDVYPCERLTDSPRLGNLWDQELIAILGSAPYASHCAMTTTLPDDCQRCRYLSVCRNGCTHHRVQGKLYFCRARLEVFRHVEQQLSGLVPTSPTEVVA